MVSIVEITDLMIELAETGQAKGVIIILDTLKKFTDLMQKKEATQFGIISRGFVAAGGTLICLAHTNKHKSQTVNQFIVGRLTCVTIATVYS